MKNSNKQTNEARNKVEEKQGKEVSREKIFHALQVEHPEICRTLKNDNKFDAKTIERAYSVASDVISKLKLTKDNAVDTMQKMFDKDCADVSASGEAITTKTPQRIFARECSKIIKRARSTSSFAQDLKPFAKACDREFILEFMPKADVNILDTIAKCIYTPSRTKDIK